MGNEIGHLFSAVHVGNRREWLMPYGPVSFEQADLQVTWYQQHHWTPLQHDHSALHFCKRSTYNNVFSFKPPLLCEVAHTL